MIHPLCGNGMSMAIRSAHIASDLVIDYLHKKIASRELLEKTYTDTWNNAFASRLKMGHFVSNVFKNNQLANISIGILKTMPFFIPYIIKRTHGKTIQLK